VNDDRFTAECASEPPTEHISNVFERIALEQMQALPEQPERERRAAEELEAYKLRLWRETVLGIAKVWVAKNVFLPPGPTNQRGCFWAQTPAVRAVTQWLEQGCAYDLMLRGGVGVAKSTALAYAVKCLSEPRVYWEDDKLKVDPVSRQPRVTWLRPDQLVSAILHAYDPSAPVLHEYVILDDMGRETRTEFVEALSELFDRDGHKILISSNLVKDVMKKRYTDPRLIDRLRERVVAIDLQGDSLRQPQKAGGGF
jgi:hypothetical protein